MNPLVDLFLAEGCGRCALAATPACKVHLWTEELSRLRGLALSCGLKEERKWGFPCYTAGGRNVALLAGWKDSCTISFFKGVLIEDPGGLLELPGPNCRAARVVRLRSSADLEDRIDGVRDLIMKAIEVEKSGRKLPAPEAEEPLPDELAERLDSDPDLAAAFFALTPGRQRGYILNISGAKKSETRAARVEKWAPRILAGMGIHD
jgi:uncharacterized protein YdeI (YjbR/CyaY-like superfamily)